LSLSLSQVGLICLTHENLEAPWIMFESGVLAKNLDESKVCPILFDVEPSDIKGPLVQFQAARFEENEIRRIVRMINAELGKAALSDEVLEKVFQKWWPDLEARVRKILAQPVATSGLGHRADRDILNAAEQEIGRGGVSREELVPRFRQMTRSLGFEHHKDLQVSVIDKDRRFIYHNWEHMLGQGACHYSSDNEDIDPLID
jgi:hypothetical protein